MTKDNGIEKGMKIRNPPLARLLREVLSEGLDTEHVSSCEKLKSEVSQAEGMADAKALG
jgi:hypothetical protein